METVIKRSLKWRIVSIALLISMIVGLPACKSNDTDLKNNKNIPVQDINIDNNTNLWISSKDYQNAIKKLDFEFYNDSRVLETFKGKNPCINQLSLNDGHENYIIAWNNFGFISVMIIFLKENSNFTPIYLSKPGRDITAVKQMDIGLDEKFIEITSYFGTGSHMGQKTKIIAIKDKLITTAWDYETISYDAKPDSTYIKSYASFTIFPVIFETPRINLKQIDITGKSKKETELIFLWNEHQNKFIEK